jgi:hypothetical protein
MMACAQRRYAQRICVFIWMHGELDETGSFIGNTVVLREPLIVLRWVYGKSSLIIKF